MTEQHEKEPQQRGEEEPAPEDLSGQPGAEGGSKSPAADTPPGVPSRDDSPLGGHRPARNRLMADPTVQLHDRRRIRRRQLAANDRGRLQSAFESLSLESRYRRFRTPLHELNDRQLDHLLAVDHTDHEAIVATEPDTAELLGVARYVRTADGGDRAEACVAVLDDWQGQGLGRALLECLADRRVDVELAYLVDVRVERGRELPSQLGRDPLVRTRSLRLSRRPEQAALETVLAGSRQPLIQPISTSTFPRSVPIYLECFRRICRAIAAIMRVSSDCASVVLDYAGPDFFARLGREPPSIPPNARPCQAHPTRRSRWRGTPCSGLLCVDGWKGDR